MVAGAAGLKGKVGAPAVFLDRDGVLVVPEFRDGRSYAPRDLESFTLYPDAAEAVRALKGAGFDVIVVTNQPDIGNGLVMESVIEEMHLRLSSAMPVDQVYMCPHTRADACDCRKPAPGLILSGARDFGTDLAASFMVGDRDSDMVAGRAAGCRTIFVDLGYTAEPYPEAADWTVRSAGEAARLILSITSSERKVSDVSR